MNISSLAIALSLTLLCHQTPAQAQKADAALPTTIVFLGDSLTEGLGVDKQAAYPALVEAKLKAQNRNVKVINAGISGSTSASGPTRMRWLLKTKPNLAVIALGANDGLRGLKTEELKKNLTETIKICKDAKVRVMLIGMKAPPNLGSDYTRKFEAVFSDLAKDRDVIYLPFLLDRVAGDPKLNQADGLHPNSEGHKVMADLVFKTLEKNL